MPALNVARMHWTCLKNYWGSDMTPDKDVLKIQIEMRIEGLWEEYNANLDENLHIVEEIQKLEDQLEGLCQPT